MVASTALTGERIIEREVELPEAMILQVKPAVVGIPTEVRAEVTIRCGDNDTYVVTPEPEIENGTEVIICPAGWIATNGNVVKPAYEEQIAHFPELAAKATCGEGLPKSPDRWEEILQAILADPENRQGVQLAKRLEAFLQRPVSPGASTPAGIPAVVKAFSPPIDATAVPAGGAFLPKGKEMLDAAIIKIEMVNVPTVHLARHTTHLHLAESLYIIGFPGAVLWHDFLSTRSRGVASVTFGRVSGFKLDVNNRWVIQTDAEISWGNSGGPAFNRDGEVIGLATFITTTLEGDQAIQGFNFLIPIATIQQMAKDIRLTPRTGDPFMRAWEQAVAAYFQGDYNHALERLEAADKADKIVPGL